MILTPVVKVVGYGFVSTILPPLHYIVMFVVVESILAIGRALKALTPPFSLMAILSGIKSILTGWLTVWPKLVWKACECGLAFGFGQYIRMKFPKLVPNVLGKPFFKNMKLPRPWLRDAEDVPDDGSDEALERRAHEATNTGFGADYSSLSSSAMANIWFPSTVMVSLASITISMVIL